ncbi:MAG: ATP-binding protein [Bacteroidales bacterium]|jgi:signal transduction histidine kinase|nr:ATP-binding protein [Bacteroidales bacterium]MDD4057394.1 ATP-binding protein [Bacteroidales bacterium]
MNELADKLVAWRTTILWVLMSLMAISSFIEFSSPNSMDREVESLEKTIHKRQAVLAEYAAKALQEPDTIFVDFPELPSDMVIYRYCSDTLQSWANQLPVSNDDIDFFPFGYTLNHLTSRGISNTPLAYLGASEQYVSLGSAWYIVSTYTKGKVTVVAALLVQTDYNSENLVLRSEINPALSLSKRLSIVPVTHDESYVVRGVNGDILFSVLKNLPSERGDEGKILRLLSMMFAIAALFSDLARRKRIKQFFLAWIGLTIVLVLSLYMAEGSSYNMLFSPSLYADFWLFGSMADMMICHLYIFLVILALFTVRKSLALFYLRGGKLKRVVVKFLLTLIPLLLIIYIHITLKSLAMNSSIVLELYMIDELSVFTILAYLLYALLFVALLFSLQLLRPLFKFKGGFSFLKPKNMLIFISLASLYTLLSVSSYGYSKEFERNRVLTTKMSVERDLDVELLLRGAERMIESDPLLSLWVQVNQGEEMINSILTEQYFWSILQKYDIKITVCRRDDPLLVDSDSQPQHCGSFFDNEIMRYGIPLFSNSRFFFMNNYNGRISYLGYFVYPGFGGNINLYIELDSKFMRANAGYTELLLDHKNTGTLNLSSSYSFAKYLNNRMISFSGRYNYPTILEDNFDKGYKTVREDGFIHFVNKISGENIIMISRPERSLFPYIVTFSYIMLFFSLISFSIIRTRHKGIFPKMPRNSFRWKITILIIASLVFALFFMGAGSIWFSLNYFDETNRIQMEEKMQSVQSTLSYYSKQAKRYNDPQFNNIRLFEAMNRLADNTQIDINIYRPDGQLLRTTQPEIYDNYILGARMHPLAFREIVYNKKKQFVNKEKIASLDYYSLYAPLFNADGNMIAIANIPYFSRQSEIRSDASSIIAAIINIYLLLLIGAVFGGFALSNSLSKPLAEISRKMQLLDISQHPEHIDYNNRDELGILVAAYNKMVDDLESSTNRLAQGEREQAWREMARQIAHEIKNPLTPMRLSIQHLIRLKQQNVEGWQDKFERIANTLIEQIDILSDVASEFSSFSRFYSEDISIVDLNKLIREQIILFNTRDDITIKYKSEIKEAMVSVRKMQISRVFVNLLSNALQAIDPQNGGSVVVTLTQQEGHYVASVEDDGPGVPDNLTHRLFKPNFTTKSSGTGLGLAICKSILDQSRGEISYNRSSVLGGASFTVKIPVISASEKSV